MAVPSNPDYVRLWNEIKSNVPSAIDAIIAQELWRTIEDFLSNTNAWVEEIPFTVQPNVLQYTVAPVAKGAIERLLVVYDPANAGPDKRWVHQGIQLQMPDQIKLAWAPSSAATWMAVVSKNISDADNPPGDYVSQLPILGDTGKWIIDQYRDAFRFGTLGYLFMQVAKPYSNPKMGSYNWQNYVTERGRARTSILHANVYGGQRWMFPQAYATTARKGWT